MVVNAMVSRIYVMRLTYTRNFVAIVNLQKIPMNHQNAEQSGFEKR